MGFLRTPARLLCASGLALAAASAASAQAPRPTIQPVTAAAPAPVAAPAPAMSYDAGFAPSFAPDFGGCAGGSCGVAGPAGNGAMFKANKHQCKDGCQPYCATKTFPHSDWHYIKKYCGPSLIPDGCSNAYG